MAVLYVDEYGAVIRSSNGRVVVEKGGLELASVRIQELEFVVVEENCSLTSAAISAFLSNGVDVAFINSRNEYAGKLEPVSGKNITLRRAQYQASDEPFFCLALARRFTAAKLANMRTILMRYARSNPGPDFTSAIARLKETASKAGKADTLDELLGLEGTGSREYFSAFSLILDEQFEFDGRNRRPPLDPVNAMLGFAYALLENYVERAVSICGLDPYCGFYHRESYGRQSLVLDLMEELRPVVADSVVINCCNRGMLDPTTDFENRDGGVFLNESGRQKLFRAFETRMREEVKPSPSENALAYAQLCVRQARNLAKCIKEKDPRYQPFLIK